MSWISGPTSEHRSVSKRFPQADRPLRNVLPFQDGPYRSESRADQNEAAGPVLDLVRQLGEAILSKEEHAAEVQARAEALARDAFEKLRNAEAQLDSVALERDAADAALVKANQRLAHLEEAFQHLEAQLSSADAELSSAAARLNIAEARAANSETAIKRLEDALRKQLSALDPRFRKSDMAA